MGKKILILNGSPRRGGNTETLVDAFIEGTLEAGHTATKCNLGQMDVGPCIGCLKGGKDSQNPCTQKDDMAKIYPHFKQADIVVFASPLYCWGFTAQLKAAIDRLFAVMEETGTFPGKECLMLIAAEGQDEENFEPMHAYYEHLTSRLGWQDKGRLFAGGVYQLGDIEGKPVLQQAKQLGAGLQ
ncbi:flavodoxin family protein [Ruminococcaceae bacterium OttesenSCG-928-I18]|nr:flavodoxin family protein [Ruminococcaceae bacterium OttesenSCG-928-I18]